MLLFATAMLAASMPQDAPKSAGMPTKKADPRQRMICVESATTGSRIPGPRLCRTADEWERDKIEAQQGTERAQRTNTIHGD